MPKQQLHNHAANCEILYKNISHAKCFAKNSKPFLTKLGDSRNYMPPILVPSSAKRIATQIVVMAKVNERKDFILRGFACDIICPIKELPVQS